MSPITPQTLTTRQIILRMIVPAAIVLAGTIGTVLVSLNEMAEAVNRLEERVTLRLAEAAVRSELSRIDQTHQDYAVWDDAVRRLYGRIDREFADSNFRAATDGAAFFDTAYLLDEDGNDVFAFRKGGTASLSSREAFGPMLAKLIEGVPTDGHGYAVRSGMIRTPWGIEKVAVGPVVPDGETVKAPDHARLLVLAKSFDGPNVARLGNEFVIAGLELTPPDGAGQLAITDPGGTVIGKLGWRASSIGGEAHARISPIVIVMLLLLACIVVGLIYVALRSMRRIQDGEATARYAARHDGLTDLPNRAALVDYLNHAIGTRMEGEQIAVAYLDLDGFKDVNDAYGHEAGDALLVSVSSGFRALCGRHFLARVGGDEFVIVISGAHAPKQATDLAWALIGYLVQPIDAGGRPVVVGASAGIATLSSSLVSAEELLRRADVAMYQSKQQGRGRVSVHDPIIDTVRQERREIADDLRRALRNGGLDLAYQPVFDARDGKVTAVEALARWNRPGFGPVTTETFVEIAEETGQIDELGMWVLRRACTDALEWPGIRLSVNISPAQFRSPGFMAGVSSVLSDTQFQSTRLEMEVTEGYFISHPEQARKAIDAVRGLGIAVALDDFGTGYSSIGYLKRFTFDRLKLDRSLINGISRDHRVQRLVQATIAIADALDLDVTAEGVELAEEATLLRIAGCDEFQGFFFSQPRPASEITALLAATAVETARGQIRQVS
ncbi:MAG: EAL domain-containing protein [Rhizobiales bacterium]|nr:EAL domain-containing protein [Hyphomicrobiales bacterium]